MNELNAHKDGAAVAGNPHGYSDQEWKCRTDLAATYHLLRKFRMTDLTNQYGYVRIPGEAAPDGREAMCSQHYGWMNEEVTASNLVKTRTSDLVNLEPHNGESNPAGNEIAKAIFDARPEINCVMHVHTRNIMGVSAQKEGLQPYSQAFLMCGGAPEIAYSRYEFECTREFIDNLVSALDGRKILIEAFHGAFIIGESVEEAFFKTFYLDQACNVQLTVQSTGVELMKFTGQEQAKHLHDMHESGWYFYDGSFEWPALLRCMDRESPAYKS